MLNPDQVIELSLTVNELQVVFAGLGELKFAVSAAVIDKLRQQLLAIDPEAFGPRPTAGNGPILQPGGLS